MLNGLLLVIALIAGVAAACYAYFIYRFVVNHNTADYRGRIEFIWSGTIPHQPTPAEKARVQAEKILLLRLLPRLFNTALPDNKPYILVYPAAPNFGPAVIIAPGGAYVGRAEKHEGIAMAQWLNSIGVTAFVLNYRLDQHPAPLSDAQRAIQYVRANATRFHIDPARIGLMGFSAGGHLAATAGTHLLPGNPQADDPVARFSSRPDFMILGYPVINFGELAHTPSRDMLIGPHPTPELIENLSNEMQVTAATPPTFIWAPKTDSMVDYRNSQVFADALAKHGVPFALHLFPAGAHGSGLAQDEEYAKAWPELCRKWMEDMGVLSCAT